MYKIKISHDVSSDEWNDDLKKSNYATYLQTAEYLKFSSNDTTIPIFISVLNDENETVGQLGMLIVKTTVQYGSTKLRRIFKMISRISSRGIWMYGPIIHSKTKEENIEILETILRAKEEIIKKYNLVFVEGYTAPLNTSFLDDEKNVYEKSGYNIQNYIVFITDLQKPIDDIWNNIQKYTKTNVKRAKKRGILLRELETKEDAKQIITLFQEWSRTKGLEVAEPEQQFEKFWQRHSSGFEKTFLAFKGEELVASITLGQFNNNIVPLQVLNSYNVSTKNLGGPALTWKAIQWSKESGNLVYDITGGPVLPENYSEQNNQVFELIHYKRKWGGEEYFHYKFLKINKKLSYIIYNKLFKILKWYYKIKSS